MKTVLIIDDEEDMRKYLGKLITRLGFNVLTAEDGKTGIELCKSEKADCVFLDIKLPDANGNEIFKSIKEIDDKTKVFIVSGDAHEVHKMHILDMASADAYLVKPFSLDEIAGLLEGIK